MKDPIKPVIRIDSLKPSLIVQKTDKLVADQGYTYNEAGQTYNEDGVMYGGIYGHDYIQMITKADLIRPSISFARDRSSRHPQPSTGRTGQPMGLLLALTYPN